MNGSGCVKNVVTTSAMSPGVFSRWTAALFFATTLAHAQDVLDESAAEAADSEVPPPPPAGEPTELPPEPEVTTPEEPAPSAPATPPEELPPPAEVPPASPEPDKATATELFASDTLGGQFQLGVSGLFSLPFGELSSSVDSFSNLGIGWGPAIDLGYGIARNVVIGAYGDLAAYGSTEECVNCSALGFGAGAFVRYHLVQGLRFDPWVSYGIGFRSLSLSPENGASRDYTGLEWLRLQFGGDWYATKQLGFGPFVELSATSFLSSPANEPSGGLSWNFQSGLRILLDLPGR